MVPLPLVLISTLVSPCSEEVLCGLPENRIDVSVVTGDGLEDLSNQVSSMLSVFPLVFIYKYVCVSDFLSYSSNP